ncbi:hypothetical protein PAXRUDRAFT_158167, partial [Paxillus rubicundulus Ve08.2h10]
KGVNGKQAAFAVRKYHGPQTLPLIVFDDLKKADMPIFYLHSSSLVFFIFHFQYHMSFLIPP